MQVSRDYVNCDRLIDFPQEGAFFKLPIAKFLEMEGIVPNKPQIAILNALNDPRHRFVVACVSRRVGKSFIAYNSAFLKLMEPGTMVLVVAPNYSLANVGWRIIKQLIRKHGINTAKENAKDNEIELDFGPGVPGSMLKIASANNADSAVGRSYDLIVFDEAAISPKGGDAFEVQLQPTLDKANSKALFISTPRGHNWFKRFYDYGFQMAGEGNPLAGRWVSIHATYRDNPRVDLSTIEDARNKVSKQYFRQEYEADFEVFEGQIFSEFDSRLHVVDLKGMRHFFDNKDDFERIFGIDIGFRDPTAILTIYYHYDQDIFYVLNEYQHANKTTAEHAQYILWLMEKHDPDYIFVDAAAAQFRHDISFDYDIPSSPAKKSVNDGLAYLQNLFHQGKIIVDASCTSLIKALTDYKWKMDDDGVLSKERPVHDDSSHLCDALRYGIYSISRNI